MYMHEHLHTKLFYAVRKFYLIKRW